MRQKKKKKRNEKKLNTISGIRKKIEIPGDNENNEMYEQERERLRK